MLIGKTSGSGLRLDSVDAFVAPGDQLWALRLVVSTVIPAGRALVGAFGREALIHPSGEGLSLRTQRRRLWLAERGPTEGPLSTSSAACCRVLRLAGGACDSL
jgi:hypothetical protein